MRFILKTAREQEMHKASRFGFIDGILLPRTEAERTGRHYDSLVRLSLKHPFAIIGIELKELSSQQLATEVRPFIQMDQARITAFLPMTLASLQMVRNHGPSPFRFGVQHAVTLLQLLAAVRSGANVLLIDASHFHRLGMDLFGLIDGVRRCLVQEGQACEVWVDGVTTAAEANQVAARGVDALVFTWDMLHECLYHPATDRALERMLTPWTRQGTTEDR